MLKHNVFTGIFATGLCLSPMPLSAQEATDSVSPAVNLQEVVVVGERAWIEGDKAVFIPTKKEKNLADSPSSLVERMHIPTVIVDRGQIKSLSGHNVAIYINGVEAEGIDLSTFWPKQTIRVEYLDHPSDPRYRNAPAVLNFVMPEYEVGGVSRAHAFQTFPNSGSYDISSKLVYRKMTFGMTLSGGYSRNHSTRYSGSKDYRDIWYGNEKFDLISNSLTGHSYSRSEDLAAALNARYRSDKTIITHTMGLKYEHNPGSGSADADDWTPRLFDSHSSVSGNRSHSLSPQLSGTYVFLFNPTWTLNLGWNYSYSHVNRSSFYQAENLKEILNSSRGNTNSGVLSATVQYMVNPDKISLGLMLNSKMDRYATEYSGSADTRNLQWNGTTDASLALRWMLSRKLFLSLDPGVLVNYWHLFGSEIYTDVKPKASGGILYNPSRHFSINGNLSYFWMSPGPSETGDVTVRVDELTWLLSNPKLRGNSYWNSGLYLTWMPRNDFNTTLIIGYNHSDNESITTYRAADKEMGGVLKSYENGASEDSFGIDWFIRCYFFNNNLSLNLQPTYRYQKIHGPYADHCSFFRMRGNARYTLGDFEVNLSYNGPEKWMTNGGMNKTWHADEWSLGFAYGNGDLNLHLWVDDIFHKNYKSWNKMNTGVYSERYDRLNTGRSIKVSVTYTIGYGKKIDRNIDISGPSEVKSAIIGN